MKGRGLGLSESEQREEVGCWEQQYETFHRQLKISWRSEKLQLLKKGLCCGKLN